MKTKPEMDEAKHLFMCLVFSLRWTSVGTGRGKGPMLQGWVQGSDDIDGPVEKKNGGKSMIMGLDESNQIEEVDDQDIKSEIEEDTPSMSMG